MVQNKHNDHFLNLNVEDCRNCYKCIRHCPVKSINFSDVKAEIIPEDCVLCGQCFVKCPQHAKTIRNDVDRVVEVIRSGRKVVASLAPSYIVRYPEVNMSSMEMALKKLGFYAADETAKGATVIAKEYDRLLKSGEQDVVISSCCHSVNSLIQKHFPESIKYLAKVLSPMQTHCKMLKKEFEGAFTVFIGPCIAKKEEAELYPEYVDAVLTFTELEEWMKAEGVHFEVYEDERRKGRARLFPIPGGIIRSMVANLPGVNYIAVDGPENCIRALRDLKEGGLSNCFIEMSMCAGSCSSGPVMQEDRYKIIRNVRIIDDFAGTEHFDVEEIGAEELHKNVPYLSHPVVEPTVEQIEEILRKIGKTKPEHELNCGSCGYNSCRGKARAVFLGKADLNMCLPFLKGKAESFAGNVITHTPTSVIVLNEQLEIQLMNLAARELLTIHPDTDIRGRSIEKFLDIEDYLTCILDGGLRKEHTKRLLNYNKVVEETIIYDSQYKILIILMRDITAQTREGEIRRKMNRETLEITDKVIEKQMRIVQEIASLLGETTAETKAALSKLQGNLRNEE